MSTLQKKACNKAIALSMIGGVNILIVTVAFFMYARHDEIAIIHSLLPATWRVKSDKTHISADGFHHEIELESQTQCGVHEKVNKESNVEPSSLIHPSILLRFEPLSSQESRKIKDLEYQNCMSELLARPMIAKQCIDPRPSVITSQHGLYLTESCPTESKVLSQNLLDRFSQYEK